jgi:glycosyltransferase involved in cell wall biosynthesis
MQEVLADGTVKQPQTLKLQRAARRILYVQYTNPCGYPPVLHSAEILAARGWDVLFLGTQALGFETWHPPVLPGIRFKHLAYCNSGWKRALQYPWFCLWCLFWTLRWRPAWIYVSDVAACITALVLHVFAGARIVYHEHDSPDIKDVTGWWSRLCFWARQKTAHMAEFCILPNENRAQAFQKQTGTSKEVKVVWNTPLRSEVSPPKRHPEGCLKLLYHGSIVPARVPLTVVHAMKKVGYPVVLRVVGYETIGSLGYMQQLRSTAEELGIPQAVEFVGVLERRELMEYCQTCDAGLAIVHSPRDPNLVNLFGASNKVFDYMACGLALIVPQAPAWQAFLPYGMACDPTDSDSIASALRHLCEHPEEMRLMGERGRQRILEQWNYETDFRPALDRLEGLPKSIPAGIRKAS